MPFDDADDDEAPGFARPLPPEDRIWRHPSELGSSEPPVPSATAPSAPGQRSPRLWAVAAVAGMLGSVLTLGVVAALGGLDDGPERVVERVPVRPLSNDAPEGLADVASMVSPAVVSISIAAGDGETLGSGIVVRDDGHVVTSAHLLAGTDAVEVRTADGQTLPGRVLGTDALTDIAVIKIEATGMPVATMGWSDDLEVGDTAVAIGSPLGLAGGPSVTAGVVSALHRTIPSPNGGDLHGMIQTDAPVAQGSSGGALVDDSGVVVGVIAAFAVTGDEGSGGLAFAVPAEIASAIARSIMTDGTVRHVWLGVEGVDLDHGDAVPLGVTGGAVLTRIVGTGPAAGSGLEVGDVVVEVDGRPVRSMVELLVALRAHVPGESVTVGYRRDGGELMTATIELVEKPAG